MSGEENRTGKRAGVLAPVRGALTALGVYLAGVALLAWAVFTGLSPDGGGGTALVVLGLLSTLLGGLCGRGRTGGVPDALLSAGLFALTLAAAGLVCWRELAWRGQGGLILLSVLAGGLLAAFWRERRGKRKKRRFR